MSSMVKQVSDSNSLHPVSLVIFGATGDLSTTKLIPALIELYAHNELPDEFRILGVSRKSFSNDDFRKFLNQEVPELADLQAHQREEFLSSVQFETGDVTDAETYDAIYRRLKKIDTDVGVSLDKLFYLALPPRFYTEVGKKFADSKLMSLCQDPDSWLRMLVEKPYGTDLKTAHEIDAVLCETFSSERLFRIDHYLAKQALHNILALRFRNQLFSGSWNHEYIDHIHVKMYEKPTIDGRGGFYDKTGAFRDVGQNHVIQLLAAATMEPPTDETSEAIRGARAKLLQKLRLPQNSDEAFVRGQYEGYISEDSVSNTSQTETYFRVPVRLENDRWRGVPIILESGKGMHEDRVEIEISFREPPSRIHSIEPVTGNTLILQFKPNHGIVFDLWTESDELDAGIKHRTVDFLFSPDETEPSAYTALLHQAMRGEQVMFANNEEVTASWEFTESVIEQLSNQPVHTYSVGSPGPQTDGT